ncbi:MAG: hypothetical protein RLZZ283_549 [Candidatus Parcubacteria bacterium]|jgi:tryptophan-rich sensory protein
MPTSLREWGVLVACIAVCQLAGLIGTIFTLDAIPTWYAFLDKPSFSPPNWLFGPVWTALYTLMGVSLYLVWRTPTSGVRSLGLRWFGVQLVLNALWSILFFGLQNPLYGLVCIILMLASIVVTTRYFNRVSSLAAWLLAPYILWVSFATLLNASIWYLN